MTDTRVLRVVAVAIAAAGLADPALTRDLQVPRPVSIVLIESAATQTRGWASAARLRSSLAPAYDVTVQPHPRDTAASACPGDGGCIVITEGMKPRYLTSGADVIGAVRLDQTPGRATVIEQVMTPRRVNLNGAASMTAQLRTVGARGTTHVQVLDEGIVVGAATIPTAGALAKEGRSADPETVSIDWIPLAAGPRRLRVTAGPLEGEDGSASSQADVGVEVIAEAAPVLMYEPEATWLGTFVRRVLAADRRLRLDARTRLAPGVTVARDRSHSMTSAMLVETAVVIVSAPESLTGAEVELLERFVRVRGGSLVLVLDRRPTGPVMTRLLPTIVAERREAAPRPVGLLQASEFLTFDESRDGITVLESVDDRPVVVSRATGRGRVIVSGALDAWRFRDETGHFTQFWSALVADAVSAAGPVLNLSVSDVVIAPGDETDVTLEWRTMDEVRLDIGARAQLTCVERDPGTGATNLRRQDVGGQEGAPSQTEPVRLWPGARRGVFTGTVSALTPGACEIQASISTAPDLTAIARLLVVDHLRRPLEHPRVLDAAIAAHGGIVVGESDEGLLIERLGERLPSQTQPRETRPMRSPWWIVPFAACLGGEWWLRRRRGVR